MSRSAFASRFKELVGETPLEYLTAWRMQKATMLLQKSDRKLIDVARSVSYDSDPAFSKASSEWCAWHPETVGFHTHLQTCKHSDSAHFLWFAPTMPKLSQTFRQLVLRSMSACLFVSASSHMTYRRLGDGNCLAQQLLLSKARQSPGWEGTDYVNKE